jgi:hypothetical protein
MSVVERNRGVWRIPTFLDESLLPLLAELPAETRGILNSIPSDSARCQVLVSVHSDEFGHVILKGWPLWIRLS